MQKMKLDQVKNKIQSLENKYNAEHDIIPGGPEVTFAEMELLQVVKFLVLELEELKEKVAE